MKGGKRHGIALLLELGGIQPGASDHIDCLTRGGSTGGKFPGDREIKRSHQGVRY